MRGYDANKRIRGRKRVVLVDVLGNLLGCEVVEASMPERDALRVLLAKKGNEQVEGLKYLLVDSGFKGEDFSNEVWRATNIEMVVVDRSGGWEIAQVGDERVLGFVPLKWRWIVERTLAWLSRCRRMARDYEHLTVSTRAWMKIGMCHLLLSRLFPRA